MAQLVHLPYLAGTWAPLIPRARGGRPAYPPQGRPCKWANPFSAFVLPSLALLFFFFWYKQVQNLNNFKIEVKSKSEQKQNPLTIKWAWPREFSRGRRESYTLPMLKAGRTYTMLNSVADEPSLKAIPGRPVY
jgi:hypothetical protein